MFDIHNRKIEYIRISVTDRCNLRCVYCMPDEGVEFIEHEEILSFDEILRLINISTDLGITKVKITGGEPLVRKGVVDLIKEIKKIEKIQEVTLTTNGILLGKYIDELKENIDGINISLDALDPEQFKKITRRDELNKVIESINLSVDRGIKTKINTLVLPNINENQIINIVELARNKPIHVRFIEVMPIGYGKEMVRYTPEMIRETIEKKFGKLLKANDKLGNGPAKYYSICGFKGKIGFISAVSDCFCSDCNRIRLTSTGFLKACLQYNYGIELKPLLREGYSDDEILQSMSTIVYTKPKEHQFNDTIKITKNKFSTLDCGINPKLRNKIDKLIHDDVENDSMSKIGG